MTKNVLGQLSNPDAERSVLGAILIDNGVLAELASQLGPDDFFIKSNGVIYQAMLDLFHRQAAIDVVTLEAALGDREVGNGQARGMTYLTQLMISVASSAHALEYCGIVRELAERRRLVLAGQTVAQLAIDRDRQIESVREKSHQAIIDCMTGEDLTTRPVKDVAGPYMADIGERMEEPGKILGLSSGYPDLDRLTKGLRSNRLYIIAGRPGMGKTALLLGIAFNLAVQENSPGVFFSLEMGADELLTRLIARRTRLNTQAIETGDLAGDDGLFYRALGELSESPLWIDDSPGLSVLEMRARAMRTRALNGGRLDWIMVDFLQLARAPGLEPGYNETSYVARELKNMAKALSVPVLAACQLNRSNEGRQDKRPLLADLRGSGQIEEAADLVGLLYRPDYYQPTGPPTNIGEVHIGKHRGGPTGKFDLYWMAETASYFNLRQEKINLP